MKKHQEVSSFNTSVPKILIIWYITPKIWHMADVIIFYFGLFLPLCLPNSLKNENFKKMKRKKTSGDIILHECTKNHDHMLYYSWDMVHERCNYFLFLAVFPLLPINSPKNQIFKKVKKMPGYIIILHLCTKNYEKMMFGFWDRVHDGRMDRPTEKVTYRGGCST